MTHHQPHGVIAFTLKYKTVTQSHFISKRVCEQDMFAKATSKLLSRDSPRIAYR